MELTVQRSAFRLYKKEEKELSAQNQKNALLAELKECICEMRHNEEIFNLIHEEDLIDAAIYERQALLCKYNYLLRKAKDGKM